MQLSRDIFMNVPWGGAGRHTGKATAASEDSKHRNHPVRFGWPTSKNPASSGLNLLSPSAAAAA